MKSHPETRHKKTPAEKPGRVYGTQMPINYGIDPIALRTRPPPGRRTIQQQVTEMRMKDMDREKTLRLPIEIWNG